MNSEPLTRIARLRGRFAMFCAKVICAFFGHKHKYCEQWAVRQSDGRRYMKARWTCERKCGYAG